MRALRIDKRIIATLHISGPVWPQGAVRPVTRFLFLSVPKRDASWSSPLAWVGPGSEIGTKQSQRRRLAKRRTVRMGRQTP
jgi:hypothetical protein